MSVRNKQYKQEIFKNNSLEHHIVRGHAVAQLVHASRKVAVSIPDGATGIFRWRNSSGPTLDLGSTQPTTDMNTGNISLRGKCSWCVKLIIISFMQDIYTHIPETNYVPREYSVAAILLLLFTVLISLVSVLNLL